MGNEYMVAIFIALMNSVLLAVVACSDPTGVQMLIKNGLAHVVLIVGLRWFTALVFHATRHDQRSPIGCLLCFVASFSTLFLSNMETNLNGLQFYRAWSVTLDITLLYPALLGFYDISEEVHEDPIQCRSLDTGPKIARGG